MMDATTRAAASATLSVGIVLTCVGVASGALHTALKAGLILAAAALPAVLLTQIRRAVILADEDRAAAHDAGYRLALQHAAAGLLQQTPPSTPPPGEPILTLITSTAHTDHRRHAQ